MAYYPPIIFEALTSNSLILLPRYGHGSKRSVLNSTRGSPAAPLQHY